MTLSATLGRPAGMAPAFGDDMTVVSNACSFKDLAEVARAGARADPRSGTRPHPDGCAPAAGRRPGSAPPPPPPPGRAPTHAAPGRASGGPGRPDPPPAHRWWLSPRRRPWRAL